MQSIILTKKIAVEQGEMFIPKDSISYTKEQEVEIFKKLEDYEAKIIECVLSFLFLGNIFISDLEKKLIINNENSKSRTKYINKIREFYSEYLKNGLIEQHKLRTTILLLNKSLKSLSAPKDWYRFIYDGITKTPRFLNHKESFSFTENLTDEVYNSWCKEFRELYYSYIKIKNEFIQNNIGIIGVILNRRKHIFRTSFSKEDLYQEATFGLIKAVDKFDYTKNFKFSTYSGWWIQHYLQRSLVDKDRMIRKPVYVYDQISKLKQYINKYKHKDLPEHKIIAKDLKMDINSVTYIIDNYINTQTIIINLDEKLSAESEIDYYNLITNDSYSFIAKNDESDPLKSLFIKELNRKFNEFCKDLSPKERSIIKYRFGIDKDVSTGEGFTLSQVGKMHGLCRQGISRVEAKVLEQLKQLFSKDEILS
mgnify:CR=1 FL=1